VTPSPENSWARVLVMAERPARRALLMVSRGVGCLATREVMWTMRPHRRSRMPGRASRQRRTTFMRVDWTPHSHWTSVRSRKVAAGGPPVLVTRMSTWPKASRVALNQSSMSAGFVTSQGKARTEPPRAALAASRVSRSRPQMDTRQPSAARAAAAARPRPLLPAATMATLPLIPRSMKHLPGSKVPRRGTGGEKKTGARAEGDKGRGHPVGWEKPFPQDQP